MSNNQSDPTKLVQQPQNPKTPQGTPAPAQNRNQGAQNQPRAQS